MTTAFCRTLVAVAPRPSAFLAATLALFLAAATNNSHAQAFITWQGSGTNWTTAANWSTTYGFGQLQWTGGGQATSWNDYGSSQSHWRFFFSGSTAYTLGGAAVNFFDFGGANGGILSDSTATQTLNLDVRFRDNGARTGFILNRGSGALTFGGGVEITNAVTALGIGGSNSSGIISFNGAITGDKPIVIGTNSLDGNTIGMGETRAVFTGNNTYTGATTVERGALTIANNNALGSASAGTTVRENAELRMSNNITVASETLSLSGGGFGGNSGALRSVSGSNNYDGLITLATATTFLGAASGATLKVSAISGGVNELWTVGDGTIILSGGATNTGSTAFVKTNVGTVVLSASNAWAGNEFIREGTVILNNNNALGVGGTTTLGASGGSATATLRYGANIINSNALYIQETGTGTRTLSYNAGTGTAEQLGALTLSNGLTLDVATGGTFRIGGVISGGGGPPVTVQGGGIVALTSTSNTTSARWNILTGTTLAVGASRNLGADPGGYFINKIALDGGTLRATNSFSLNAFYGIQISNASTIAVDSGVELTNPAVMGGTANITKSGDGFLVLTAANTNSGKWTVTGGQLIVSSADNLGTATGADAVTLANGTLRTAASFSLGSRGIALSNGGGTLSVAGGTSLTNSAGISGSLQSLTKQGSGTLALTGANTYSGSTVIANGEVALRGSGALSSATAVNLSAASSRFDVSGIDASSSTIGSLAGVSGSTVNIGAKNLNVGSDNSSTAYAGIISGIVGGGLTKSGSGTFTLSGNNTYLGSTAVQAGTLLVNGNQSNATGAVTVASGATLGGSGTVGGATTISGNHSPGNSAGVQTISSDLTYNANSSLTWELFGNTSALGSRGVSGGYDGVNVGGNLSFADPFTLSLVFNAATSGVDWNDPFWGENRLGSNGWLLYQVTGTTTGIGNISIQSSFEDLNSVLLSSVHTGASFAVTQLENDIYLTYTVPEPSTYALLGLGAAGLAAHLMRRRRRS